jgi:hypothetical protein
VGAFWSDYGPLVTIAIAVFGWLVAIWGWLVAIRNTRKIASRQESHALLSQLLATIDAVDLRARAFWLAPSFPSMPNQAYTFEADTLNGIEVIRHVRDLLAKRGIKISVTQDFIDLRSSLTLDVEDAASIPLTERIERADQASGIARDLRSKAYELFLAQYPAD